MEHERAAAARCIFLFGPARVQDGSGLRPFSGRRAQTMLSFLALHPHAPHRREALADLLAPDARVITVSLARRDAPLGRTLHAHEYVTVRWTVRAPEDDALADKAERRRQRLRRLLHEAEAQGAAPTDDDLARALGVSRRTILRDMLAEGRAQRPATRKRKA
jgi:hypothetical protein